MHVLSIQPVAHIVLGQVRPWVQKLTPEQASQTLGDIKKSRAGGWFLPGGAAGKTQITDNELEYMENLRNGLQGATVAPEAPMADVPNPGGPMGEQTEFGFQQGPDPKAFVELLRGKIREFGNQFNIQTIRPYNNAIQQSMQAINNLAKMPNLSPEVEQIGNQLMQLFQSITAGDAEDAQLVNQLGGLAQQLAVSSTSSALTQDSPGAFSKGWYSQAPQATQSEPVSRAAPQSNRPALYDKMQPPQQNWWQRMVGAPA